MTINTDLVEPMAALAVVKLPKSRRSYELKFDGYRAIWPKSNRPSPIAFQQSVKRQSSRAKRQRRPDTCVLTCSVTLLFRRLRAEFSNPQIVELGMAIGQNIGLGL
jgi:hypothetical protein